MLRDSLERGRHDRSDFEREGFQVEGLSEEAGEQDFLVHQPDPGLGHLGHLGLVFRTGNDEQVFLGLLGDRLRPGAAGGLDHV